MIVPKHRHRIVERNRVKRHLREAGRRFVLPLLRECGAPLDVLLRARPEAYDAKWETLQTELRTLAEDLCSRPR